MPVIRICIFEDDPGVRDWLEEILSVQGFEIISFQNTCLYAENRQEFIRIVFQSDFIITDIEMPGMNGLYLSRLLISSGYNGKNIAVISGNRTADDIPEDLRTEVKFFRKPFSTARLMQWIEKRKGGML